MAKFIETLPLWLGLAGAALFVLAQAIALVRAYA